MALLEDIDKLIFSGNFARTERQKKLDKLKIKEMKALIEGKKLSNRLERIEIRNAITESAPNVDEKTTKKRIELVDRLDALATAQDKLEDVGEPSEKGLAAIRSEIEKTAKELSSLLVASPQERKRFERMRGTVDDPLRQPAAGEQTVGEALTAPGFADIDKAALEATTKLAGRKPRPDIRGDFTGGIDPFATEGLPPSDKVAPVTHRALGLQDLESEQKFEELRELGESAIEGFDIEQSMKANPESFAKLFQAMRDGIPDGQGGRRPLTRSERIEILRSMGQ